MTEAKTEAPKSSHRYSDRLIQDTIDLWQTRYPDRRLTPEDAREILGNLHGFFSTLARWNK